ncbi:hypothetical protein C5615_37885 [Burkholderia cepacia]|uniref:Uncharacterized protein n=1 Tax=Burkholderia cepacia TaxID=292 RepID=A0A2S8HXU0_BURCE|nr:hypothetical protein C5615_37885 [Burkholderia cepacia]
MDFCRSKASASKQSLDERYAVVVSPFVADANCRKSAIAGIWRQQQSFAAQHMFIGQSYRSAGKSID